MKRLLLFVLVLIPISCSGFKALIATPASIKSLHGMVSTIATALVEAGHEVTYITPYEMKKHPNLTIVQLEEVATKIHSKLNMFKIRDPTELYKFIKFQNDLIADICWEDQRILNLWERRSDFDIFMTFSYYSELVFPFLMNFTGSFVQLVTPGLEPVSLTREGNWLTPAVAPSILTDFDDNMNFWERATNLRASYEFYKGQEISAALSTEKLNKYFPQFKDPISYYDRIALTLINGHFALDGPVPLLPSQIQIGTINAKKPQPLPKDFEDFIQESGDAGVIYFSLGSIARSTDIPKSAKKMLVEAFKRIPQRVIWKYEGQDVELPPNVKSQKWMPQQDILGHPKTRLFISHCGNIGTQEAKYHGVPVLALPIAFDQPRNAAKMARKGYALVLQWEELTTDKIVEAINTIINDQSYQERLTTISRILQDQKDTPAERAVWWMEYVVRHKGAPHLQYAGKRLSLFQYVMLDVILFWLAVITGIIIIFVYFIKLLCCSSIKPKAKNKKQ